MFQCFVCCATTNSDQYLVLENVTSESCKCCGGKTTHKIYFCSANCLQDFAKTPNIHMWFNDTDSYTRDHFKPSPRIIQGKVGKKKNVISGKATVRPAAFYKKQLTS